MNGKHVTLRALEPADVDLLYEWENDERLWYISNTIEPYSRFALEQYVMNVEADIFTQKQLRLMIDLKDTEKTIGHVDLFDFDPRNLRAGIGIMIHSQFRNKGYAADALEVIIRYGFEEIGLHQFYCNITPDNEASIKLFQSKGFVNTGTKKEWLRKNGQWQNELFFQLIGTSENQ